MNKSKGYKVHITETLEKDVYIIADSERGEKGFGSSGVQK